jgi:hypothetical protein
VVWQTFPDISEELTACIIIIIITLMTKAVRTSENVGLLQRDYTALYPRRLSSSS